MKNKKTSKKLLALLLAILTVVGIFAVTAGASNYTVVNAFTVPSQAYYAKTYTLSSSGITIPYTSSSLSRRGTENNPTNGAYIDNATDELYVLKVGSNWAYVSYPVSSGRRNAYIPLSAISPASYSRSHYCYASATGKFYCSPRRGGATASGYYVDRGDKVYVLYNGGSTGTNVQIMYPVSGGKWRIAWCTYDNVRRYLDNSTTGNVSTSGNVASLKGVSLYEYPIGSSFPSSSYYCNVNGKSTYVGATQCYGFACYCEMKLYGCCWHTASSHFPNLSGSENVNPNAAGLKDLITRAGVGAHLRTKSGHSMVIAGITSTGFTVIDANAVGTCRVDMRTYTWSGYLSTSFGQSGIKWIEVYR